MSYNVKEQMEKQFDEMCENKTFVISERGEGKLRAKIERYIRALRDEATKASQTFIFFKEKAEKEKDGDLRHIFIRERDRALDVSLEKYDFARDLEKLLNEWEMGIL